MAKSSRTPCTIAECEKTCSEKSRYDICEQCRNAIGRAIRLGPGWVIKRNSNLSRYSDRMTHLKYRRER